MAVYFMGSPLFQVNEPTPSGGQLNVPGIPASFDAVPGMPYNFQTTPTPPAAHAPSSLGRGTIKARAAFTSVGVSKGLQSGRDFVPSVGPVYTPHGNDFGGGFGTSGQTTQPVQASPVPNGYQPPSAPLPPPPNYDPTIQIPSQPLMPYDPAVALGPQPAKGGPQYVSGEHASGEQADQSEFAVRLPTWALVLGAATVIGLGAFALHRTLPARR